MVLKLSGRCVQPASASWATSHAHCSFSSCPSSLFCSFSPCYLSIYSFSYPVSSHAVLILDQGLSAEPECCWRAFGGIGPSWYLGIVTRRPWLCVVGLWLFGLSFVGCSCDCELWQQTCVSRERERGGRDKRVAAKAIFIHINPYVASVGSWLTGGLFCENMYVHCVKQDKSSVL